MAYAQESGLSPRNRGLAILVGSTACVLINLYVMRAWGEYYMMLFPFAGAMAPVGGVLLVTGVSTDELKDQKKPLVARIMLGLMLAGLTVGLLVNHLVR